MRATRLSAARRRCKLTADAVAPRARVNAATAAKLGFAAGDKVRVSQGEGSALLDLAIDERLADGVVRVAAAHEATVSLGPMFGPIRVERGVMESFTAMGSQALGAAWPAAWALARIVAIVVPVLLMVAYLTYWERKLIGWMHIRIGPNRVGPLGLLQPIADAVKLIFKEVITPAQADKWLLLHRAGDRHHAGARRLGGDPVRAGCGARRRQCRAAVRDGDHVGWRVRRDRRRLGVELEVRVPRRDARRRADGQLRAGDGIRPDRGAAGCGDAEHDRDRRRARAPAGSPTAAGTSCRGTGCRCCRCS